MAAHIKQGPLCSNNVSDRRNVVSGNTPPSCRLVLTRVRFYNSTPEFAPVPLNQGSLTGDKSKSWNGNCLCQPPGQTVLQWGIIYAIWSTFDTCPFPS